MTNDILKRSRLLFWVLDATDTAQHLFGQSRRIRISRQTQDTLLDVGREAQEHEDLGHSGAAEALPPGDFGLAGNVPDIDFVPPRDGFSERFDRGRGPGLPRGLGPPGAAGALGDGRDHLVGGHRARQMAKVALLKGPVGAEGHFHLLFVIGGRTV